MPRITNSRAESPPAVAAGALVSAIDALLDYYKENQGRILFDEDFDKLTELDGTVFALAAAANLLPLPATPHEPNPRVRRLGYTGVAYCVWQRRNGGNQYNLAEPRLSSDGQWEENMRSLRAAASALAEHKHSSKVQPLKRSVDKEDELILRALANNPCLLFTVKALWTAVKRKVSVKVIAKRLTALLADGLAARPKGQKQGATITEAGKQLVDDLPKEG
jgi:hypothetical protein